MAIRRTREEKIRIQQRREKDKFEWQEISASTKLPSQKRVASKVLVDPRLDQERQWLKKDLLQTLIALFVVCLLLSYFFWRSIQ